MEFLPGFRCGTACSSTRPVSVGDLVSLALAAEMSIQPFLWELNRQNIMQNIDKDVTHAISMLL